MSSDPDGELSTTNTLLRHILTAVNRERLGLISDPPGRRTIYANRVKAPDGALWYFYNSLEGEAIEITERAVRGRITDVFVYDKESSEGTTTKLRVGLNCGDVEYEIETTLKATSGTGILSGLLEAGGVVADENITVGVQPADQSEQVLFMSVYTDQGGLQYPSDNNKVPTGNKKAALSAVETVREALGLDPDPWTDRYDDKASTQQGPPPSQQGPPPAQQGPPPRGQSQSSAPSEKGGQTNNAAETLINKLSQHEQSKNLRDIQIGGDPAAKKVWGLAEYIGRDEDYMQRIADVHMVDDFGVLQVRDALEVINQIVNPDALSTAEEVADDTLPF